MKKIILSFMAIGLIACNNNIEEEAFTPLQTKSTTSEFQNIMTSLENTDTVFIKSIEDFNKDYLEKTKEYNSTLQYYISPMVMPKISITDYTTTGYDSETIIRSTKMMFSKDMAELLRVFPNEVYIVQYKAITKNVQRAQNSTFIEDEDCQTVGWRPIDDPTDYGWTTAALGYAPVKIDENTQRLTSQCAQVAYNILGQEIKGIYYPQRLPSNYKWTYSCLIK